MNQNHNGRRRVRGTAALAASSALLSAILLAGCGSVGGSPSPAGWCKDTPDQVNNLSKEPASVIPAVDAGQPKGDFPKPAADGQPVKADIAIAPAPAVNPVPKPVAPAIPFLPPARVPVSGAALTASAEPAIPMEPEPAASQPAASQQAVPTPVAAEAQSDVAPLPPPPRVSSAPIAPVPTAAPAPAQAAAPAPAEPVAAVAAAAPQVPEAQASAPMPVSAPAAVPVSAAAASGPISLVPQPASAAAPVAEAARVEAPKAAPPTPGPLAEAPPSAPASTQSRVAIPAQAPTQVAPALPAPEPVLAVPPSPPTVGDIYRQRLAEFDGPAIRLAPQLGVTAAPAAALADGGGEAIHLVPPSELRKHAARRCGVRPLSAFDGSRSAASFEVGAVRFGEGTAEMSAQEHHRLREVAKLYREMGGTVRVLGYSASSRLDIDPLANRRANRQLAAQRADAVAHALVHLGVPGRHIFAGAALGGDLFSARRDPSAGEAAQIYIDY